MKKNLKLILVLACVVITVIAASIVANIQKARAAEIERLEQRQIAIKTQMEAKRMVEAYEDSLLHTIDIQEIKPLSRDGEYFGFGAVLENLSDKDVKYVDFENVEFINEFFDVVPDKISGDEDFQYRYTGLIKAHETKVIYSDSYLINNRTVKKCRCDTYTVTYTDNTTFKCQPEYQR